MPDLRWTDAEYADYLRRQQSSGAAPPDRTGRDAPGMTQVASVHAPLATDRYKSKTERRFAQEIAEVWRHEERIKRWWYEPLKGLYLAPATSYTPDFLFELWDRLLFIEVKGEFVREKDWLKAKMAAQLYPCFQFKLAKWAKGQWQWKDIPRV